MRVTSDPITMHRNSSTSGRAAQRTRGWRPGRVYFLTLLEPLTGTTGLWPLPPGRPVSATVGELNPTVDWFTAHAADRVFLDCRDALASRPSCLLRGDRPLAVELIGEGRGAGVNGSPAGTLGCRRTRGPGSGMARAVGRVPADPGRSGTGRRAPAGNHRVGRGSGRRPGARERGGGVGRWGPGSPGYRRVRPPYASRPACHHAE